MTRARTTLIISAAGKAAISPFVHEAGVERVGEGADVVALPYPVGRTGGFWRCLWRWPLAGRVQHAQHGQSAAIVIDAMDHGVVGAHHDFTGLQREDGPAASRTEGAGGDAAGATTGGRGRGGGGDKRGAGPRSPKSLAGLLVALVRLVRGIAGTCFQRQKGVVSENGKKSKPSRWQWSEGSGHDRAGL